ncbi:hypothetical protein SAMN02745128_02038 [Legionella maceachernii]|nr:hypothetical protein SAMN02745128_02038 [Legionella maceachernii]
MNLEAFTRQNLQIFFFELHLDIRGLHQRSETLRSNTRKPQKISMQKRTCLSLAFALGKAW